MDYNELESIGTMFDDYRQFKVDDIKNLCESVKTLADTNEQLVDNIHLLAVGLLVSVVTSGVLVVKGLIRRHKEKKLEEA